MELTTTIIIAATVFYRVKHARHYSKNFTRIISFYLYEDFKKIDSSHLSFFLYDDAKNIRVSDLPTFLQWPLEPYFYLHSL